jgi:hypothetical protein
MFQRFREIRRGRTGIDQQAVTLPEQPRGCAADGDLFGSRHGTPVAKRALQRRLGEHRAAMNLAQQPLFGHQGEVAAHRLARRFEDRRQFVDADLARLLDQQGDALTAFFGLHIPNPPLPVRSIYDSKMTVRSNIVNISSCPPAFLSRLRSQPRPRST